MTMPKVIEKQPDLASLWLRCSNKPLHYFSDLNEAQREYERKLYRHKNTLRARISKRSSTVWTEEEEDRRWRYWRQRGKLQKEYEIYFKNYQEHIDNVGKELKELLVRICESWIEGERLSSQRLGLQQSSTYVQDVLQRCFQDVQDFVRNPPPTP